MPNAEEIITRLNMQPLPDEGGFYIETYRSSMKVKTKQGAELLLEKSAGTAIQYLITEQGFSALHRIKYDEIFHFYLGQSIEMFLIHPDGTHEFVTLGSNIFADERVQVIVPAGTWQGARLKSQQGWALLGTTVAPGFEFSDFELGSRDKLIAEHPALVEPIEQYTRK